MSDKMETPPQDRVHKLIEDLKRQRDELRLQMHLAGMEAKNEWDKMDGKLAELTGRTQPLRQAVGESAEDVWEAVKLLGSEIKDGFDRIRKAL
ncbi:MAG: hypothetical protein ACTHK7_09710 [Aureliella sp.]